MADRRLVRRATVLPVVLVLVAAGGGLAWANSQTPAPTYRTAAVTRADVEQLLTLTGITHQVAQAKASFPVSGTVTGVAVQVGDSVAKGQPLARIDAVPLQRAVIDATATLARAQATLATDETTPAKTTPAKTSAGSSRSSTAPTTSATPASRSHSSTRSGSTSGASASAVLLTQAQQAVLAASQVCATGTPSPSAASPSPTLTASPNPNGPASASPSPPPRVHPSRPAANDCTSALRAALAAEQRVVQAEAAAQKALQSTAARISAAPATVVRTAAANTSTRSTTAACLPAVGQAGGGGGGMSSAARITTDTAAISAAQVALDLARRNLAGATLLAPLAGKVATQPFAVGSRSGNNAILIVAPGATEVTVDVPETQLLALKVGQPAAITTDGSATSVTGTVMQIGLLPTSSSNGSATTYPVLIQVRQPGAGFVEGGTAAVAITVKVAHNVLTVPNSALSGGMMTVLAAGKTTLVGVQTGVVGALRSEITSGARAGEQVVLADLSATLPANSTTTTRNFGGKPGRVPGAVAGPRQAR